MSKTDADDVIQTDGLVIKRAVYDRIKNGCPPDCTDEEFRAYAAIALAKQQAAQRIAIN